MHSRQGVGGRRTTGIASVSSIIDMPSGAADTWRGSVAFIRLRVARRFRPAPGAPGPGQRPCPTDGDGFGVVGASMSLWPHGPHPQLLGQYLWVKWALGPLLGAQPTRSRARERVPRRDGGIGLVSRPEAADTYCI